MRSMTGFGQGAATSDRLRATAIARSVNHRYLDIALRLREDLRPNEANLRATLQERLLRGRVEVTIEVDQLEGRQVAVEVDRQLLAELRDEVEALRAEGLIEGGITLADLARFPEAVRLRSLDFDWTDDDLGVLREALTAAIDQLIEARSSEGDKLKSVIAQRVDGLDELCIEMKQRAAGLTERISDALKQRLSALHDEMVDPGRMAQEVALLADKADVSEEIDRLCSHLEHMRELIDAAGTIGKRLDFLSQEIFRELNTIGSKSRDAELTRHVLAGKALCEQVREQVQNVE